MVFRVRHSCRIQIIRSCQTPIPGQTWELTLFSRGNNKKNDPHLNSPRRGCARVLKFCMRPSVTKIIRLNPLTNSDTPLHIYFGVNFTFLLEGVVLELWNFACSLSYQRVKIALLKKNYDTHTLHSSHLNKFCRHPPPDPYPSFFTLHSSLWIIQLSALQ